MRKAEEILNQFYNVDEGFTGYEKECFIKAINEARKEAIEECAKRARVTDPYQEGKRMGLSNSLHGYIQNNPPKIDKQSILSLIEELK